MNRPTPDEKMRRAAAVGQADQELRSLKYRGVLLDGCEQPERVIRSLAFWRWQAGVRGEGAVR